MRLRSRCLATMAISLAVVLAAARAGAETCHLELKRLESARSGSMSDYTFRITSPQYFFMQIMEQGRGGSQPVQNPEQAAALKRAVTKEPAYVCDYPFRGVVKLGTQEYGFVLDAVPPKPADKEDEPNKDKPNGEKPKADDEAKKAKLQERLFEAMSGSKAPALPKVPYNRLYFDFNHNGDLTDDKVLETPSTRSMSVAGLQAYWRLEFPRVDVAIDVGGTKMDYSLFVSGSMQVSRGFAYAQVQINSATYREGEITLGGKKRHVYLIDFTSNGRFDDQVKVKTMMMGRGGKPAPEIYPQQGDMLLVDPKPGSSGMDSPYDVTASTTRHYVAPLVSIDDTFYDLKVSPAGDELTLTPSPVALGSITNPNDGFRALIYSDLGVIKIRGNKNTPVAVPEGQWKLLSYTIDLTPVEKPAEPKKEETQKKDKKKGSDDALVKSLAKKLDDLLGGAPPRPARPARPRNSLVAARGSADYKAVQVSKGKTVEFPFGPPYKPVVTAEYFEGAKQLSLGMTLVGSTGEQCTNLMVDGGRPSPPKFTITDPKGEVVREGNFEYG